MMPKAYCVYDEDDSPRVFYACEIKKMCKFIGCTVANLKQSMSSKRRHNKSIGNGYKVMQEDDEGIFKMMIG